MHEDSLYWLDQLDPAHRPWVGDKAFYLGLLTQRGYPTVPGCIISAAVLPKFLEHIEWKDPLFADLPNSSLHIDVDNPHQLRTIAQHLQQSVQATPLPPSWLTYLEPILQQWQSPALILRPSLALPSLSDPTVSLKTTGLLQTEVCWRDRDALAHSLKQVWAGLFQAKSLLYWQRLKVQLQQIHLAILIQPIASVKAAGSATIQDNSLEVQSVWGLGRALVSGEVNPDRFRVDLQTGAQSQTIGNKLYAYRILGSVPAPALPFQTHACYELYNIETPQQSQPALNATQVDRLQQMARQMAIEMGTALELEWIWVETEQKANELQLTQVIPQWVRRVQNPVSPSVKLGLMRQLPTAEIQENLLNPLPPPDPIPTRGLAAAPGRVVAPAWVTAQGASLKEVPAGVILVARSITPDMLPFVKSVVGIVTEQGGMTSHGAILARELGIPAVTGVNHATNLIQSGEMLLMDGDRGEIQSIQSGQSQGEGSEASHSYASNSPEPAPQLNSLPIIATQLFVTLSQTHALAQAARLPVEGVGLLRSELMMQDILERRHPHLWIEQGRQEELIDRLAHQIYQFAQAFAPRPVFYRSSDWRSHEFTQLQGSPLSPEANPMLGLRGTFSYQVNSVLFEVELAALRQVQQAGYGNLRLILPFVRSVEEFRFCRQRVEQAGLDQQAQFRLWIMAEVPSVLFLLPEYVAAGVQGIAIGSNDLTQLMMGVDRDQPQMASAFNAAHPAVMQAIHHLIQAAQAAQIPCSICGQAMSQHPEIVDSLVRWGITAISVDRGEIETVYRAIARAEHRLLLLAARQQLNPTPI